MLLESALPQRQCAARVIIYFFVCRDAGRVLRKFFDFRDFEEIWGFSSFFRKIFGDFQDFEEIFGVLRCRISVMRKIFELNKKKL